MKKIDLPNMKGVLEPLPSRFCTNCADRAYYRIDVVPIKFDVRGLEVECKELRAICLKCGNEIYVPEINDKNVSLRQSAYLRALRGVK